MDGQVFAFRLTSITSSDKIRCGSLRRAGKTCPEPHNQQHLRSMNWSMRRSRRARHHTHWRFRCRLTLALLGASLLSVPMAQAKDYLIEIVVFSQPSDGNAEELWNNDTTLKKARNNELRAPRTRAGPPQFYSPVLLSNAATAIARRSGFEVLSHIGWRQSGTAAIESPVIRLPRGNTNANLEGWVRIYLKTYIFAELDLTLNNDQVGFRAGAQSTRSNVLTNPGTNTDTGPFANTTGSATDSLFSNAPFRLREKRRVKFREVHYFDHPRFGVILTVQPAETSG